ncbi:Uncharacterised protein [Bordetella pertussis]|nr:Uncharacterised protein [Bordetella pertussis]CFP56075.1 Uncharacterised protein [Bordetella pertussis]
MRHEARGRVAARVGFVQAALVGQDDERIGFDQVGDQGAQGVVVAEADFVGDDGVVFVDDGHYAQAQQGEQGRARIQVAVPVGQVFVGEQDLRGAQAELGEGGFVSLAQAHLAHGGGGLQFVHGRRALAPAQPRHAFGNGAAGNQHDLLALLVQGGDLGCPVAYRGAIEAPAFVGDQRGTHFGDQPIGRGNDRNGRGLGSHGDDRCGVSRAAARCAAGDGVRERVIRHRQAAWRARRRHGWRRNADLRTHRCRRPGPGRPGPCAFRRRGSPAGPRSGPGCLRR